LPIQGTYLWDFDVLFACGMHTVVRSLELKKVEDFEIWEEYFLHKYESFSELKRGFVNMNSFVQVRFTLFFFFLLLLLLLLLLLPSKSDVHMKTSNTTSTGPS
jgi:hypothetical protein